MLELTERSKKALEDNNEILREIEEWISSQPHIPNSIPRAILHRYYKVCQCDLEETKKLIDINVKFRMKHQSFLTNRDFNSEELQRVIGNIQYTIFPKLTKEGYAIESYRIIDSNIDDFILKDIFKYVVMVNDGYALIEPDTNGLITIYDANGFTLSHFMRFVTNMPIIHHFSQYGQEAYCVDLKQIHFINCSQTLTRVISFLKPVIGKELQKKFVFHDSGLETLHEIIDKDCLPTDVGGSNGTFKEYADIAFKIVQKYHDFLNKDENFFLLNE
ncbi:alpha-tocopherol transfer protein-like [Chironomus tepperi]|uniref:alpha-tocopherol transfer protein-like n=1 Tax=Chironomus tepperi TaxID=113505 RepID=UPI00391EE2FF